LHRPTYSKGKAHLSVTQLINSPKIVALTKKFDDEIEQDVSEMVWSIFGTAVHGVLEHGKDDNHRVEERLHAEVDGWKISGAIDLQIINEAGIDIRDYKTTSAWAVMNEKIEWEHQLNIYAWLVETVKKTPVTGTAGMPLIVRDTPRRRSRRSPSNYGRWKSGLPLSVAVSMSIRPVSLRWRPTAICPPVRLMRCGKSQPCGRSRRPAVSGLSLSMSLSLKPVPPWRRPVRVTRSKCVRAVALGVKLSAQSTIVASNGASIRRVNEN